MGSYDEMFRPLRAYHSILSPYNAKYVIVYANGKRKSKRTWNDLTEQELNTKVLNIFAEDTGLFKIYLTQLEKGVLKWLGGK